MRYVLTLMASILLIGCTSTRVLEVGWNDPGLRDSLNAVGILGIASIDVSQPPRLLRRGSRTIEVPKPPGRVQGGFALRGDSLVWSDPLRTPVPVGRIEQVSWIAGRDHAAGLKRGAVNGALVGGALGFLGGLATTGKCEGWDLFCGSDAGDVARVTVVSAAVYGLAGAFIGAIVGARNRIVYRFLPDTPRQITVVVGMSPAPASNGFSHSRE